MYYSQAQSSFVAATAGYYHSLASPAAPTMRADLCLAQGLIRQIEQFEALTGLVVSGTSGSIGTVLHIL